MNQLVPPSAKYRWLFVPWMVIIVVVFWVMVFLIQEFDFDQGKYRAAVLALVLIATPVLMYLARSSVFSNTRVLSLLLSVACVVFMCWHFVYFAGVLFDPRVRVIDIASTTLKAGDLLLQGKNPYSLPMNPQPTMSQGRFSYDGFKYLPMMAMIYAPLGSLWRERGLLTTNLLLDIAVVVLVFLLGAQMGTRESGLFAALLYLMLPIVPYEIFHQGVTDLAAIVPLLFALLLLEKRPGLTGLCIGISVSTKLLPGALFLLCCLPTRSRWRYLSGFILGLVPTLVFFVLSPMNLISNNVIFNIQRPLDSTSWLYGMSSTVRVLAFVGLSGILFAAIGYMWFKRPTLEERCGLVVICILSVLLSGPVSHRNYQLWWLPFFAVLVGAATFRCGAGTFLSWIGSPRSQSLPATKGSS
jgi:hypothetical protein